MKTMLAIFFLLGCFLRSDSQTITDSILIEGNYRTFNYNKPPQNTKNFNLIFVLHGSGGNGMGIMKEAINLEKLSASEHILLVYPDGYKRYWNECRKAATSAANIENVNEQAFFESMLAWFAKKYQVNDRYFFATGISGGGHMCYKLALTIPGKCKAIAPMVANLPDSTNLDCTESKVPVAVMIINGTKDATNPYNGGPMMVGGSSYGSVRSTDGSFGYWSKLAGYKGSPLETALPDPDPSNQQTITQYTFREKGKPEVTLLKVTGGEHAAPKDVDGFLEAWKFFKRQI